MLKQLLALCFLVFSSQLMAAEMRDAQVAMEHGNNKLAKKIMTELAEKNDPLAQMYLASWYTTGARDGSKPDLKKAVYWFEKCTVLVVCKLELAKLLGEGKGAPKDTQRALDLYKAVIDFDVKWPEGKDEARVKAGLIYFTEKKYKDRDEAERLFTIAANHGNSNAQFWTGVVTQMKQPPEAHFVEAYKFFYLANSKEKHYSAISAMESLEKKMTRAEIEQAKEWANAWSPTE